MVCRATRRWPLRSQQVRQSLADIVDNDLPGEGSYRKYTEPIGVIIEGSCSSTWILPRGSVGPAGMPLIRPGKSIPSRS